MMFGLANPDRFMRVSAPLVPILGAAAAALLLVGLWLGFTAPEDYQQGDTVRIMFVHVPAAWTGLFAYLCLGVASFFALVFRHSLADLAAAAAALPGAVFTALALITGSLWGKPMWGAWWVWDARLTSELILLFLYLGVIALNGAFSDRQVGAKVSSLLALIGVINLPIIHFSVEWWNTLHQGASITKFAKPSIDPSMLWPLLISILAFAVLLMALTCLRLRTAILVNEQHRPWVRKLVGG